MDTSALLVDGFTRVSEGVTDVLDGVTDDELSRRPGPQANPVDWLVWHLLRVQDSSLAALSGRPRNAERAAWSERLACS